MAALLSLVWAVALPLGLTILAPARLLARGLYPSSSARAPPRSKARSALHVAGRLARVLPALSRERDFVSRRELYVIISRVFSGGPS